MFVRTEATATEPVDPLTLTIAAEARRHAGEVEEAIALYDQALAAAPEMLAALYGRGLARQSVGQNRPAEADFLRVTKLAPQGAPAFAGLAAIRLQAGDISQARKFATRAAQLDPRDAATLLTLADCDFHDRRFAAAAASLRQLSQRADLQANDRIVALTRLGDTLDRLDDANGAFEAYATANMYAASLPVAGSSNFSHLDLVRSIDRAVAELDAAALAGPVAQVQGEARTHVFVTGYPRSGNTLVEQILATIPGVETTEEAPTLQSAEATLLNPGIIGALAGLSVDATHQHRTAYWQSVRKRGIGFSPRAFVDMDPFKSTHLPIIARLFPEARVVVMRRDPRDVVLSCFRHSFVRTPATAEFTSLESTARHYDAVMRLTETCLERLPIRAHVMNYGSLVRDFDTETQRLCDFTGLRWSPKLRNFQQTAQQRSVKTASAAQVRRGLYDGSGQWRRYRQQLEPVLPILEPWVERFGFAP